LIHRDGDWHRSVHIWILNSEKGEVLIQKRSKQKDSYAGLWDIGCAGHISAGDSSIITVQKELSEELGVSIDEKDPALQFVFSYKSCSTTHGGKFINNEYADVYIVEKNIDTKSMILQQSEVELVKYISLQEYFTVLMEGNSSYVPCSNKESCKELFDVLRKRVASKQN